MRVCNRCGQLRESHEWNSHRWCKPCQREYAKARHAANPEPGRERALAWARANPEKAKARIASWKQSNKGRLASYRITPSARAKEVERIRRYRSKPASIQAARAYQKAKWASSIQSIDDGYVASTLCAHGSGLRRQDIPLALSEAKRIQLQIKRYLKNGDH